MPQLHSTIRHRLTLQHFEIFDVLAQCQSFRQTAKICHSNIAKVSTVIKQLEQHWQVTLFHRTTREVRLTQEGQKIWAYIKNLLECEKNIHYLLHEDKNTLSGQLKIGIPNSLYHEIYLPQLGDFFNTYPKLKLDFHIGNFLPALIKEDFDVILFCGKLPPIDAYAQKLGNWQKLTCASPAYLANHPALEKPEDLPHHRCLDHAHNFKKTWEYQRHHRYFEQPIDAHYTATSSQALKEMAIHDLGVIFLPSFSVDKAIDDGRLQVVLKDYQIEALPLYLITKHPTQFNAKLTAISTLFQQYQSSC
ncbi:MAG: LysR family transcriptional regulator [Francisellaceae bacterium]